VVLRGAEFPTRLNPPLFSFTFKQQASNNATYDGRSRSLKVIDTCMVCDYRLFNLQSSNAIIQEIATKTIKWPLTNAALVVSLGVIPFELRVNFGLKDYRVWDSGLPIVTRSSSAVTSREGRAMLRVIEYFAKSLGV